MSDEKCPKCGNEMTRCLFGARWGTYQDNIADRRVSGVAYSRFGAEQWNR